MTNFATRAKFGSEYRCTTPDSRAIMKPCELASIAAMGSCVVPVEGRKLSLSQFAPLTRFTSIWNMNSCERFTPLPTYISPVAALFETAIQYDQTYTTSSDAAITCCGVMA